jgi:hypothetical protein
MLNAPENLPEEGSCQAPEQLRWWGLPVPLLGFVSATANTTLLARPSPEQARTSEKLKGIADPEASITWAWEMKNLNKRLLTPSVQDAIIRRINDHEVTNSKELRSCVRFSAIRSR